MLLKLFLVFVNTASDCAREIVVLVWPDVKFSHVPIGVNVFAKLLLNLHLLESGVADILNVFLDNEEVSLEQVLKKESLRRIGDFFASEIYELLPMALLDALVSEHFYKWKHDFHVVKALLELFIGWVLFAVGRQAQAVLLEQLNAVFHTDDFICNLQPGGLLPLGDRLSNLQIKCVKFVKLVQLILGLNEGGIALMWQSEQLLTRKVRLVFTVVH